mmetsp:Transcript_11676/g.21376  ORF Transcript_11676/g.21376 Transcript_11676/m.21376 type:complete len:103 (-) Transcript_11676:45-353(-)
MGTNHVGTANGKDKELLCESGHPVQDPKKRLKIKATVQRGHLGEGLPNRMKRGPPKCNNSNNMELQKPTRKPSSHNNWPNNCLHSNNWSNNSLPNNNKCNSS